MKMRLSTIASASFRKSLDRLTSQELPIKAMFHLRGIIKQLREEIVKWDESQNDAAKKWATKDDAGNPIIEKREGSTSYYKMDKENMLQFAAEIGELAQIEIEVPDVDVNALGDVKLTLEDLVSLEFIVDGETTEKPKKKKK